MVEKEDRPGETTEATNHNTHSHRQEADTPEGTSAGGVGERVYARAYPIYDQRGWPNSLKLTAGPEEVASRSRRKRCQNPLHGQPGQDARR